MSEFIIAYDGSDNAKHAITVAGELFDAKARQLPVRVVHAWETASSVMRRYAVYSGTFAYMPEHGEDEALAAETAAAQAVLDEGVALASGAGFVADGELVRADASTREVLERYVNTHEPALVIMGTRGLSGIRSVILGSVSGHVAHHTGVATLIVPAEHSHA